jgi:16S rRNA (guanine527-N7)-methyltransferase
VRPASRSRTYSRIAAERRKCDFLERFAPANARVVWGRAEEQGIDWAGVVVAKALAQPPTAAEWCLPLVRPGGAAILWVGPTADAARVGRVASRLAATLDDGPPGFLVLRKLAPTPPGFPRRVGVARKRPLG